MEYSTNGVTYKAVANGLKNQRDYRLTVAVKLSTPNADGAGKWMLLNEARIMAKVGRHLNIVNLLGIVLQSKF